MPNYWDYYIRYVHVAVIFKFHSFIIVLLNIAVLIIAEIDQENIAFNNMSKNLMNLLYNVKNDDDYKFNYLIFILSACLLI